MNNHTSVVILTFFVNVMVLQVWAFWWSLVMVYFHCIQQCVSCIYRYEIVCIQKLQINIFSIYLPIGFLHLLKSWKQKQWVCCFVVALHPYHTHWHLSRLLGIYFYDNMWGWFSKGYCRSTVLITEMHYWLMGSSPILTLDHRKWYFWWWCHKSLLFWFLWKEWHGSI